MEKINISITQAQLKSFETTFNKEGLPDIVASLGLFTEHGKEVSSYSLGTRSWSDDKFTLPPAMIEPIMKLAKELEKIVTKHCREGQCALPEPVDF